MVRQPSQASDSKKIVVKDTLEFVKLLRKQTSKNRKICSFDVKNLFTSIPVDDTIEHILSVISENEIKNRKHALRELLKLACKEILFTFNDVLYIQTDGMSMGSCLAPTMDMLESRMKEFTGSAPVFYKRYVDDIFCIFDEDADVPAFHGYLNNLHSDIKFTYEEESSGSLVFLDTTITKNEDAFDIAWYLKETNTGIYTPNCAYSPKRYRLAAMRSLFNRALKINSNVSNYKISVDIIHNLFLKKRFL